VSSVDKRRRERLRAKRELAEQQPESDDSFDEMLLAEAYSDTRPTPTKRVKPADGRQARLRRKKVSQEAKVEIVSENAIPLSPIPDRAAPKPKNPSLRERRAERHENRLRKEGVKPHRPETRVRPKGVVWISWRWFSAGLIVILLVTLYAMLFSDLFYIDSMAVGGVRYLTREQIFESSGLANKHLFWVKPDEVEAHLEDNPTIVDAQVYVGWPPNMVSIFITERDPAIIWEQGDFRVWVDVNGIIMFQREEREDLVRVVYQSPTEPLDVGKQIDRNIIAGALQLKAMFPSIERLLYDPVKGLGYEDGRNWIVWFGTGTNMQIKAKVYDTIVRVNYPSIQFREVDVSDPDHPVFVDRFPTEE
jgi:cell division septal protein FtsQ